MTLRTRLERIERRAVPTATNAQDARAILAGKLNRLAERCEPAWFTLDEEESAQVIAILADFGIEVHDTGPCIRIAEDGLVEMPTDVGVMLGDAQAIDVVSRLSQGIANRRSQGVTT